MNKHSRGVIVLFLLVDRGRHKNIRKTKMAGSKKKKVATKRSVAARLESSDPRFPLLYTRRKRTCALIGIPTNVRTTHCYVPFGVRDTTQNQNADTPNEPTNKTKKQKMVNPLTFVAPSPSLQRSKLFVITNMHEWFGPEYAESRVDTFRTSNLFSVGSNSRLNKCYLNYYPYAFARGVFPVDYSTNACFPVTRHPVTPTPALPFIQIPQLFCLAPDVLSAILSRKLFIPALHSCNRTKSKALVLRGISELSREKSIEVATCRIDILSFFFHLFLYSLSPNMKKKKTRKHDIAISYEIFFSHLVPFIIYHLLKNSLKF